MYALEPIIQIIQAKPLAPLFNQVLIRLANPMDSLTLYNLTVKNLIDCSNNLIGNYNSAKAGLKSDISKGDVVINEILFNPVSSGFDYVEIYNAGNNIADMGNLGNFGF